MSMTCKATIRLICEYLKGASPLRWRVKFSATWGNAGIAALFSTRSSHAEVYFDREVEPQSTDHARVA